MSLSAELEASLRERGTPERALQEQAYLKSSLTHLGTTVPDTRTLVKAFMRAHPELSALQVRELAAELWDSPIFERRAAAVMVLIADEARSEPGDLALVERFLRAAQTWALVDSLSCDVSGALIKKFPHLEPELDRWAADDNFWVRRAALLSLLVPLRRGVGRSFENDWEHFVRLAEPMLEEREFFIRKALGWVLRETAKKHPELVEQWLRPRAAKASRLTLREAAKPLAPEVRSELFAAAGIPGPARTLT
jgi:3-methyladenine DNA glycosylase AlkD